MPNGKLNDNPLSDMTIHGRHPFPPDLEVLLLRLDELGRAAGYWPLGENCPFEGREFEWERGKGLDEARREVRRALDLVEAGCAREVLHDPLTGRPFADPS